MNMRGFTIIEIIVVVAVVGVMASVTIVGGGSYLDRAAESNTKNSLIVLSAQEISPQLFVNITVECVRMPYVEIAPDLWSIKREHVIYVSCVCRILTNNGKKNKCYRLYKLFVHFYFIRKNRKSMSLSN